MAIWPGGVTLTVTDSAAAIDTGHAGLGTLNTDGHLASVVVQNATVAALAAHLSALQALPSHLVVSDSAANIAADLTGGSSVLLSAGTMTSTTLTAGGTVNAAALTAMAGLTGFALGGHTLTVSDTAANILTLGSTPLSFAATMAVHDTGSQLPSDLAALQSKFAGFNGSASITLTGGGFSVTTAQYSTYQSTIDAITNAGSGTVTGTATTLAGLASTLGADGVIATAQLSANATIGASTIATLGTMAKFAINGHVLTLADNAAGVLALSGAALNLATNVSIADSVAHVTANFAGLSALTGYQGTLAITLTDSSPAIALNAANAALYAQAIGAITNAGVVTVTDSAAAVSAIAALLSNTASVGAVDVTDTAANAVGNLGGLGELSTAGKLQLTLSDTSIGANLVAPLLTLASSLTNTPPVVDTPAAIAALAESGASALAYLNAHGASLNASGSLAVADAAALEGLTNFSLAGHALSIWDTATHLMQASSAVLTNGAISGVYLKTSGGAAVVSAANAASLLGISGFSSNNPDGSSNNLSVADTAAHLVSNYTILAAHLAQFTGGVVVNAGATVTDAVLGQLQALTATAGGGATLTVRDTAAAIAASAVAQAASAYITPTSWALSASATVSESAASVLGGLTGFNPGSYKLTLSLSGDTTISVSDANNLGAIHAALLLGGHRLLVSGTASALGALSANALTVVTPQLSDTFANVLAANASLLTDRVTVTDSEQITTAQATSFLDLLTTNGGAINPTLLSFASGQREVIADTVANLQALQASTAWTQNAGVHAGFSFTASDTVANLIASGNASFLASVTASTLASSQTTDAASAETLATTASAIHFSLGGSVLTVSDTASNLLNPNNADGLALAGVVKLSGPATVDAADAESLLTIGHFTLDQTLTIADSSSNLLDGVLAGDISTHAGHVVVELAATEYVDAQTASSLVALTGFADPNHYFNIADSSSYLLNSANLTAEQIANSVTLAGDETVSANTVLRLSEVPHFTPGSNTLNLASNDFADAATLQAIGGMGSHFSGNGHSITVTAETLDLTPAEYASLQNTTLTQNGHVLAAISDASNTLTISGLGVHGDAIKIYDHTGSLISNTSIDTGSFTVTTADSGQTHNFAITDMSGSTESAPVIVLDAPSLVSAVSGVGATFATYGEIQVGTNQYINLYQSSASLPSAPALVYNPSTHVVSLDIPSNAPIALITLGGSTPPGSLTPSEIFIKHHG